MKKSFLLLVCFLGWGFTVSVGDVKLEYVFRVGDEYAWKQVMSQTVKQSIPILGDQLIENWANIGLNLKVVSLTPDGAKVEARYTAISMQSKVPAGMGESMLLDSEGAADKTENRMLKVLINKAFTLLITKQGKIEKIEGLDNLWMGFNGLAVEGQRFIIMKQRIKQNLSERSIRNSFESALMFYPGRPVKPGETWEHTTGVPGIFPLEMKNTWRITDAAGDVTKLTADGIVSTTDKEKVVELPNGLKSKADLKGSQKLFGTADSKTGWPMEVKMTSTVKGNMTLLAGGMILQDMQVPMEIVTENVYMIGSVRR